MKNNKRNKITLALSLSMTALLAACGGGGGSSSTATTGTSSASSSTSSSTGSSGGTTQGNVGSLSTPTYAAGSPALAAFDQLNQMRQTCTFPQLAENSLLDKSVANHWNYVNLNGGPNFVNHYETSGNPGFTGVTPENRAAYVGYPYNGLGEVITDASTNVGGAASITSLGSTPYHATLLFGDLAEIGIVYQQLGSAAGSYYEFIADMGAQTVSPTAPTISGAPLTWPCQGATNVERENLSGESPTPYVNGAPANNVAGSWGTPIVIEGGASDTITLSSVSVTGPSGNVPVSFYDSANDPNNDLAASMAFAIPNAPLAATTTYSVVASGTINGTPFSRSFSFTTGN